MGLFGKILQTGFDVVTAPIDVARDIVEMGTGQTTRAFERTKKKTERVEDDAEEIRDELGNL